MISIDQIRASHESALTDAFKKLALDIGSGIKDADALTTFTKSVATAERARALAIDTVKAKVSPINKPKKK